MKIMIKTIAELWGLTMKSLINFFCNESAINGPNGYMFTVYAFKSR